MAYNCAADRNPGHFDKHTGAAHHPAEADCNPSSSDRHPEAANLHANFTRYSTITIGACNPHTAKCSDGHQFSL